MLVGWEEGVEAERCSGHLAWCRLEPARPEAPRVGRLGVPDATHPLTGGRPPPGRAPRRCGRSAVPHRREAMPRGPRRSIALPRRGVPVSVTPVILRREPREEELLQRQRSARLAERSCRLSVDLNADDTAPYGADQYTQRLERRMAEVLRDRKPGRPPRSAPARCANGLCASISLHAVRRDLTAPRSRTCTRANAAEWSSGRAATPQRSAPHGGRQDRGRDAGGDDRGGRSAGGRPAGPRAQPHAGDRSRDGLPTVREVWSLAAAAHAKNMLFVHMDGARSPTRSRGRVHAGRAHRGRPASISCRSARSKNGALSAEAVVFFNRGSA